MLVTKQLRSGVAVRVEMNHPYGLAQLPGNRFKYGQTDTVIATGRQRHNSALDYLTVESLNVFNGSVKYINPFDRHITQVSNLGRIIRFDPGLMIDSAHQC